METGSVSVVIPVYNSSATLGLLMERVERVLRGLGVGYEVVLVDDGSRDGSWRAIEELRRGRSWISAIQLPRNYGQHAALLCGIRAAAGERIVTMDDDLQNPPEEIVRLLERLEETGGVVYGVPERRRHGLWRNISSGVVTLALSQVMGVEAARKVSPFRAFPASVREAFAGYQSPYVSIDALLSWGAARFEAVTVRHDARQAGASQYTLGKLVTHGVNMVAGFSTLPLRMASILGFTAAAFGLLVLAFVMGRYWMEGGSLPGFPFLASVIAIFSGVQLFALGIIGEYLARMHTRMMDRPPYVVARRLESRVEKAGHAG